MHILARSKNLKKNENLFLGRISKKKKVIFNKKRKKWAKECPKLKKNITNSLVSKFCIRISYNRREKKWPWKSLCVTSTVSRVCRARMGPANSQFHLCKVLYNLEKKFSPFYFPVGLQVPVHSKRDGHFLATLIPFRINGVGPLRGPFKNIYGFTRFARSAEYSNNIKEDILKNDIL